MFVLKNKRGFNLNCLLKWKITAEAQIRKKNLIAKALFVSLQEIG
jgi:hypothetical protein